MAFEPDRADNVHRLNMGVFPVGAEIIANPYNKIPGFSLHGEHGGAHYFVPGFPVMAAPMMAWALDTHHSHLFHQVAHEERSVIVYDGIESTLTPLMEALEAEFSGVKVFSLPSVDHPQWGKHIELGVKGEAHLSAEAFAALKKGLQPFKVELGPEMVR